MSHIPVLLDETMHALQPKSGGIYLDATLGDGGHSLSILRASEPDGKVVGLDQDAKQVTIARKRLAAFNKRVTLVTDRFGNLENVACSVHVREFDGILFDLGFSSTQVADTKYGLNYLNDDSPLDMRLSHTVSITAADILNRANEQEIADVLYHYGDRHNSRTLAHKIVQFRRKQSFQVAQDVKTALDLWKPSLLAPIFQALRIAVNQEFDQLEAALPQALTLLKPGGVLAVITFHSGEDRIVKPFMKANRESLEVSRLVVPTYAEMKRNSRARSAKLRCARTTSQTKNSSLHRRGSN